MSLEYFFMPEWATGATSDYCVGAQLCTKDGRRMGNAVIAAEHSGELSPWEVVTDAGTSLRLNTEELIEIFHEPRWLMNVSTAPGVCARTALSQPDPELPDHSQWMQP